MSKVGYKNKVHKEPKPKIPKQKKKKPGPKVKRGPKINGKKPKEKLPPKHKNINKNQKPIQKKTFPDYKGLSDKEFYEATAQWADMYDKQRMERYTKALAEVIIHELLVAKEIRVPYLGMFYIQEHKGYIYNAVDKNGNQKQVKVPKRNEPLFVPCDSLINDVNDEYMTKERRRREERGNLSWRDYARDLRNEMFEAEVKANATQTDDDIKKLNKLKEKFRQTLRCNDVRSVEKIIDIEDEREEQLLIKKERKEKLEQKEKDNE